MAADANRPGRNKGFAFIEFVDPTHAATALNSTNGELLKTRPMKMVQGKIRTSNSHSTSTGPSGANAMSTISWGNELPVGFAMSTFGIMETPSETNKNASPYLPCAYETTSEDTFTDNLIGYVDSACTRHLCNTQTHLQNLRQGGGGKFVTANCEFIQGTGLIGDIKAGALQINDVEHIAQVRHPLLSVAQFLKSGTDVWFDSSTLTVNLGKLHSGKTPEVWFTGPMVNDMFPITLPPTDKCLLTQGRHGTSYTQLMHSRSMHQR